jgi:hypothetical protein
MREKQTCVEKYLTLRVQFHKLIVSIDEIILALYTILSIMSLRLNVFCVTLKLTGGML